MIYQGSTIAYFDTRTLYSGIYFVRLKKNKDYLILFNFLNFSKYIYIFNSKDNLFYLKLNNNCCTSNNIPVNGEYYAIVEEKRDGHQVSLCSWRKKLHACRFKNIWDFKNLFFCPDDRVSVEFDFGKKSYYTLEADFQNPSPVFFKKIHELTEERFFSDYTVDENLNVYKIPC